MKKKVATGWSSPSMSESVVARMGNGSECCHLLGCVISKT